MDQALLTYDSVEISYHGKPVVHEVSVSLQRGEILGIVGESGSGKTTMIKAALGLLGNAGMVTKGDIWFDGKNLPDMPQKELRNIRGGRIGMIFQDAGASLCPIRTIGSQIIECMQAHGMKDKREAKERALTLFSELDFEDGDRIWKSYPFELSGGMNQRAGIAMAMLMHPEILLADEPTSALDVAVQKQAADAMLRLRDTYHTAMLLVTHDIGLVSYMADRILVLKDGCVMECGETKQVLSNPQHKYTKELLASVPRLRRQ